MSTALVNGGFSDNEPLKLNGHPAEVQIKPDENIAKKNRDNLGYSHEEQEPSSPTHGPGVHQRVEAFQKIAESPRSAEIVRTSSKSSFDYGSKEVRQAKVNRDVQILNHCIDEIEAFIVKLREMNDARKRLSRKGNRKSMKKKYDKVRDLAKGPDEKKVVDIYQKFKHSFNLLGRLRPHITDPNAPDLVNYLIVPLEIIVKVLGLDGARRVESPLLAIPAIELLSNCLKSKDEEFWKSLGIYWYLPASAPAFSNKSIPPYIPVFSGWTPPEIVVDDRSAAAAKSAAAMVERMKIVEEEEEHKKIVLEERQMQVRENEQETSPPKQTEVVEEAAKNQKGKPVVLPKLKLVPEKKYASVVYDYWAHNNKELTIRAGERVTILDDSRRWWLVQNQHDEKGYVPSTVLDVTTSDSSSETSAESSLSPAASPSETKNITLATQIQETKIERTVVVNEEFSPQPEVVTPKSIITDSSQFSNPSSPETPFPPKVIQYETIESSMKLDEPPTFHPPPPPPQEPQASPVVTESIVVRTPSLPSQPPAQPTAQPPAQPPPKPTSKPTSQPIVQHIPPPSVVVSVNRPVVEKEGQEMSLQEELNVRLQKQENSQSTLSAVDKVDFFIPLFKSSTADDVTRWLKRLDFEPLTVERLSGVAAKELFKLQENELVERLGEDEGKRLYNELQVQSGAMTRHKTMTEFQKALLERMKRQETIKQNITKHQVTVKTSGNAAAPSQEEMQRKFKEQQDLIKAKQAESNSRKSGSNINNNNESSPVNDNSKV